MAIYITDSDSDDCRKPPLNIDENAQDASESFEAADQADSFDPTVFFQSLPGSVNDVHHDLAVSDSDEEREEERTVDFQGL